MEYPYGEISGRIGREYVTAVTKEKMKRKIRFSGLARMLRWCIYLETVVIILNILS